MEAKFKTNRKNKYNILPLNINSIFNIFLILGLKKNFYNRENISFYYIHGKINQPLIFRILNVTDDKAGEIVLIQVELDKPIEELKINIGCIQRKIKINIKINNYFSFDNFGFVPKNLLFEIPKNMMFDEFFEYFRNKSNLNINFKEDMIKSFSKNYECLPDNNILKLMKYCANNKIKYCGQELNKENLKIMKQIPITDIEPNYKNNIELIKNNKLIEYFLNTKTEKIIYEIILEQITKITDLQSIFDIFPIDKIKTEFAFMINQKIKEIKYTILEVTKEKYDVLFNILDKFLYINLGNSFDVDIKEDLFSKIDLAQYYYHLINEKTMVPEGLFNYVLNIIIEHCIQYFEQHKNHDLLINILLNPKIGNSQYILQKINCLSFDENDFYQQGNSSKLIFYNNFIKKCNALYIAYINTKGTYPYTVNKIKKKILNVFQNGKIKYKIISERKYEKKIKLITKENEAQLILGKLENYIIKCNNFFNSVENILDYYLKFFPISKKSKIELINQKLKYYKENEDISQIIKMDINKFFDEENICMDNIKYKYSKFFILIYRNHYKKDKSEEIILEESIDDFKKTFEEIIEKLESNLSLYEINNIDLIVKESSKPEFNLDGEIYFLKNEFSFLNKDEYILTNLKNDFIQFIEQYQFVQLIKGIIELIKYYNKKANEIKESYLFNNLRIIYEDIISKNWNEENIKKLFKPLKLKENYQKGENILFNFYKLLFEKKESISFLQNIEYSIKNRNANLFFDQNEIHNLLNIYRFFKRLLNNKKIQSDKDFYKIYNDEIEKNNNIKTLLNQINNKYINYLNKQIKSNNNLCLNNENFFSIYFDYCGKKVLILGNLNENMKIIINRFIKKTSADKKSINLLYNGKIVKEDLLLNEVVNKEDKLRKEMNIVVNSINKNAKDNQNNSTIKSKEVICPKCLSNINLKVQNYKITLFGCKNGHLIKDLLFKDFLDTQNIDLKKIKCDICKQRNKYESFNNEFFICLDCYKNLCTLCKSVHDKSHHIINYDKRNSSCEIHLESYNSYCKSCQKNLCIRCEKEHDNHEKINYGSILPDPNESEKRIKELEKSINQLNANIDYIINRLKSYKENMNYYYQIYVNIMENINNQNRSYELLNNMNEIAYNNIMEDIKSIVEKDDYKNKLNLIFDIIDKKENFDNDTITLIYKVNNTDKIIKIFDSTFVQNNKDICKIKYENKEFELSEYFLVKPKKDKLVIKLKGYENIINANRMFYECKALISIPDIIKWNLSNVCEKNEMFYECNPSLDIPELLRHKFLY